MDLDFMLSQQLDEQQILTRFDELVANGTVIYNDYRTIRIQDKGLSFEFRILKGMAQKPSYTNADGSLKTSVEVIAESKTMTGCKPGSDINVEGYEVATLGCAGADGHILAFNKFPAARPHFLILTANGYRRQFEPLDERDLWAMWTVMGKFNGYGNYGTNGGKTKQRHISFFNCGLKSGCSRLHKHMQVFPILAEHKTELEEGEASEEFKLWPDIEDPEFYEQVLPFTVAIARLNEENGYMTRTRLLETYQSLLKEAEGYLGDSLEKQVYGDGHGECESAIPHNVLLDRNWMVVIPRRAAGWKGADCNAISMLGMNWVSSEEKIDQWARLGPAEVLKRVGVPVRE
ncbi:ATP adenylyltransferase domain containing protein [Naviculisporaceae sp. PSN 640]